MSSLSVCGRVVALMTFTSTIGVVAGISVVAMSGTWSG